MKNLSDVKILVVGDLMLDKYTIGNVNRISPEAPVPIVNITNAYEVLGGCGNVALNLKNLGVQVSCLASVGDDVYGKMIKHLLEDNGITSYVKTLSRLTTVKERIVAGARQIQMLRLDWEVIEPISYTSLCLSIDELKEQEFNFVIISDYAKGFISYELVDALKYLRAPIIADPKPKNIYNYSDIFMITPNKKEFEELHESKDHALYTLVTLGREGMKLYESGVSLPKYIKSDSVEVFNTAGAGDVSVAAITVAMAIGFTPYDAAVISNACARESVTHVGTCTINKNIFDLEVKKLNEAFGRN